MTTRQERDGAPHAVPSEAQPATADDRSVDDQVDHTEVLSGVDSPIGESTRDGYRHGVKSPIGDLTRATPIQTEAAEVKRPSGHLTLDAALRMAAAGWPVFPCVPNGKVPATRHGFRDASTDPEVIRKWWTRAPNANLAIATGVPAVDVLDVDVKGIGDGLAALQHLRAAGIVDGELGTVRTPSGGLHIYYRGSRQGNGSLARKGVDFRGLGGYVLVPPSTVDGKPYELVEWRPGAHGQALDWQAVRTLLAPERPDGHSTSTTPPIGGVSGGTVSALARWLSRQPEGGRNNAAYWAACRAVENGNSDDLDLIVDAAIQAGLPEQEARKTVQSAARRLGAA